MKKNSMYDERGLLLQLSQGSEIAFRIIYESYAPRLYRTVLQRVKSDSCANDILQDVFLKIWESHANIKCEKSISSFLFRMADNKVVDFFRKLSREKIVIKELTKENNIQNSDIEQFEFEEKVLKLNKAIDSLPAQRKKVFKLCKFDGKSYKEVSNKLGISTSTISDHIVKANEHISNYVSCSRVA